MGRMLDEDKVIETIGEVARKINANNAITIPTLAFTRAIKEMSNSTGEGWWQFEAIEVRTWYAKCPKCGFSFKTQSDRELPYFCGGCGKDMRQEADNGQIRRK